MPNTGEAKRMPRNRRPLPLEALIFDMDGVLIDVSDSYRETIRRTVQFYLSEILGLKIGRTTPMTPGVISLFKSTGGFNNDWELTSAALLYALPESGISPYSRARNFSNIEEAGQYLREIAPRAHSQRVPFLRASDLTYFLDKVKSLGGGLRGIRRALKKLRNGSWDGWVYGQGSLEQENIVQRVFQEVYLGKQFKRCYGLEPLFYQGPGDYLRETLLIPKAALNALHRKFRLAIATGRPKFEAELALKRFHIESCFDTMVTLDECRAEETRVFRKTGRHVTRMKPHPYSLLRAIHDLGLSNPRCAYVGDTVDDMRAAQSAGRSLDITAIGFLGGRKNRAYYKTALLQAGADYIIKHPEVLLRL